MTIQKRTLFCLAINDSFFSFLPLTSCASHLKLSSIVFSLLRYLTQYLILVLFGLSLNFQISRICDTSFFVFVLSSVAVAVGAITLTEGAKVLNSCNSIDISKCCRLVLMQDSPEECKTTHDYSNFLLIINTELYTVFWQLTFLWGCFLNGYRIFWTISRNPVFLSPREA